MIQPQDVEKWIKEGLPESQVEVTGDGYHFEATVASQQFVGKSLLQQHRMIFTRAC